MPRSCVPREPAVSSMGSVPDDRRGWLGQRARFTPPAAPRRRSGTLPPRDGSCRQDPDFAVKQMVVRRSGGDLARRISPVCVPRSRTGGTIAETCSSEDGQRGACRVPAGVSLSGRAASPSLRCSIESTLEAAACCPSLGERVSPFVGIGLPFVLGTDRKREDRRSSHAQ